MVKNLSANAGDSGSILGLARSPGEDNVKKTIVIKKEYRDPGEEGGDLVL